MKVTLKKDHPDCKKEYCREILENLIKYTFTPNTALTIVIIHEEASHSPEAI